MTKAILYFTKWGATRQYAEWIANAVPGTDLVDANATKPDLSKYDTVIIASRVFMGQIAAKGFLASHWDALKDKKVYLLVVGVSPEGAEDSQQQYKMLPEHIRSGLAGYRKVTGVIDMTKLNFILKKMMNVFTKKGEAPKLGGLDKQQVQPVIDWLEQQV